MSGCASVTKRSGKPARRSPPPSTNCSRKLRSLVSAPRFPLRNLLACRQGAFAESPSANWRRDWAWSVVEYTNLYTNETFDPLKPDATLQAKELSAVRARVGGNLTPENVALPGLRFTTAFMLSHAGHPLGVIAYV